MSTPCFDLNRIRRETQVGAIEYREELASTNDLGLQLAQQQEVTLPLLVLAARQTAGRGRGDRRWWSDAGALTFSVVLDVDRPPPAVARQSLVSLTTALAISEALESLQPGLQVGVKWPNDVLVCSRKICGVLLERPARPAGRLVVGIGLNVNNSFAAAPTELQHRAISLRDAALSKFDLNDVLIRVLQRLADRLEQLIAHRFDVQACWRPRCVLTGRGVRVQTGRQSIAGVCRGIDESGALVLETPAGRQCCHSGTVESIDPD